MFYLSTGRKEKIFRRNDATAFVFVLNGVAERFIKLFYPPLRSSLRVYSLPRLTSRLFDPSFFASAPANRIRFPPLSCPILLYTLRFVITPDIVKFYLDFISLKTKRKKNGRFFFFFFFLE